MPFVHTEKLCPTNFAPVVYSWKLLFMANDLNPYENITRVFWIKIELQENHRSGRQALGEIKDVMSGTKSPIRNLLDIIEFMIPYMQQMGIRVSWFPLWRFTIWMKSKMNLSKGRSR